VIAVGGYGLADHQAFGPTGSVDDMSFLVAMTRTRPEHADLERHRGGRASWLRAGVLGANDGLISTASLMVGVAAANSGRSAILVAGFAGLTAGALAMAAGEYVSVSSQRDTEQADIERERRELEADPDAEHLELARIYRARGFSDELSTRIADELSHMDRLTVHARDELGIDIGALANPVQASVVSALSFTLGALTPVIVMMVASKGLRVGLTMAATLIGLGALGAAGARLGGAPQRRAAIRVLIGGSLALLISLGIGRLTGSVL
jgi:vacuolar iron transporter family protein